MSEISLRDYLAKLDNLLNANSADEVIQHCRHILQYFPKNVAAYRYLGRALVENGRWDEASSALQRVLSVIPDDFVAHVGLSESMERTNHPDDAIWHLERAFEQRPADKNILEQLRSLYNHYHGVENAKIPLTAVAVARQAMKTQSYAQAADTLRGALARSSQRVDLRLLLAEVLWEAEARLESAELAMDVLEKLPDCLIANRIMAGLWLTEGRPTDAQRYINHLESVDPYLAVELVTSKPVEDNAFRLEELDFRRSAKTTVADENPDWLADITSTPPPPTTLRTIDSGSTGQEPPPDDQWDQWVSAMLQGTSKPAEKPADSGVDWLEAQDSLLESGELNPFHVNSTGELEEIDTIFQTGTFEDENGFDTDDPVAWLRERGLEIEESAEVPSQGALLLEDAGEFKMPEPEDPTAWMGQYNLELTEEPDSLFGDNEPITSIGSPNLQNTEDDFDWMEEAPSQESPLDEISEIPDWSQDPPSQEPPLQTNMLGDTSKGMPGTRRGLTAMFSEANFDWTGDETTSDNDSDDEWISQFDDKKKLSAVTTTTPDWLSSLDDSEVDIDLPDPGTLTWGKEVPQSGGDEMPDNMNADANANDDAFAWMSEFDDESLTNAEPASADVPDWLSELKPSEESESSASTPETADENDLGWMSSFRSSDDAPESGGGIEEEFAWLDEEHDETTPTVSAETPEWLAEAAPDALAPAASTSAESDAFDWMSGIDFGDEPLSKQSEPIPDWLNETEMEAESETPADSVSAAAISETPANEDDELSWMSEFGALTEETEADAEFGIESAADLDAAPDWLSELEPKPEIETPADAVSAAAFTETPVTEDDDLEWMSEFGDLREETAAPVAESAPDWLSELESESEAEDDDAFELEADVDTDAEIDWLSELDAEPEIETPADASPAPTTSVADDLSWMDEFAAETPKAHVEPEAVAKSGVDLSWMDALSGEKPDAQPEVEAEPVAAAMPDWLSELEPDADTEADEEFALDTNADLVAATPDWLNELESEVDAEPVAAATPDWLSELEPEAEAEFDPETDGELAAATPDWLSELDAEPEIETPADAVSAEALSVTNAAADLSWMDAFSSEKPEEDTGSEPEPTAVTPDWLSALEPEAEADAEFELKTNADLAAAAAQDWLKELEPENVSADDVEPVAESTPDWLSALEPEAEAEPAADAVPDWLSEMEPETEAESELATDAEIEWLTELDTEPAPPEFDAFNMPLSEVDAMSTPPPTPNAEIDWVSDLEPALELDDEIEDAVPVPTEEFASMLETEAEPEALPDAPETAAVAEAEVDDDGILPYTEDEAVIAATPEEEFAAAAAPAEDVMPILGAEVVDEVISSEVTEPDDITEGDSFVTEADNAPDWLNAMVPGLDVDYAPTETLEQETPEVEEASPREFAWLNKMVDEEIAEAAASTFIFTKTPAWLDRLVPPAQPAAPQPDEDFPDWVSDDDADLPEWLR